MEIINNLAIRIANLEVEKAALAAENKVLQEQVNMQVEKGGEDELNV